MDNPGPSRRKRTNSDTDTSDRTLKRTRTMPPPPPPTLIIPHIPPSPNPSNGLTRIVAKLSVDSASFPTSFDLVSRAPSSAASSASGTSRSSVPPYRSLGGHSLMRSASFSSFHTPPQDSLPNLPEGSARYNLRPTRLAIDFLLPTGSESAITGTTMAPSTRRPVPLAYSAQQVLYFSRGNRVHYRSMLNIPNNAEVGQLCRIQEKHGELAVLQAGGAEQRAGILALTTTSGNVQLWDTERKKMVVGWTAKGASTLAWNGHLVTVGTTKGGVRHYDTRIQPTKKMKEQATRMTRHEAKVGALLWNVDGRLLASGDDNGVVFTWDNRSKTPLDVGEFHQRRKKIQHKGYISALAWCPWQPKLLTTGDSLGDVKFWTVDASNTSSNATTPSQFQTGSEIVGLHFSTNFKELLTTVGSPIAPELTDSGNPLWPPPPNTAYSNTVAVYSFPSLRPIAREAVDGASVMSGSVLSPTTANVPQKLVVAVPEEGKLTVFDVWAKRKEIRRQASCLEANIR
ncbi:WD40-repeat-containing domain protein [Mycena amicta]|nr:WD40-repeat-containing domain protein [Mycena amicta]